MFICKMFSSNVWQWLSTILALKSIKPSSNQRPLFSSPSKLLTDLPWLNAYHLDKCKNIVIKEKDFRVKRTLFMNFSRCDNAAHEDRNQQSPKTPCLISSLVIPSIINCGVSHSWTRSCGKQVVFVKHKCPQNGQFFFKLWPWCLTLTDGLDLGTKGKVLPQELHMWNLYHLPNLFKS